MSGTICPGCGKVINPFQTGGGEKLAKNLNVPFLGRIPLDPRISEYSDKGVPFILESTTQPLTKTFNDIVKKVVTALQE